MDKQLVGTLMAAIITEVTDDRQWESIGNNKTVFSEQQYHCNTNEYVKSVGEANAFGFSGATPMERTAPNTVEGRDKSISN